MIEKTLLAVIGLAALAALTLMCVAAAGVALFLVLAPLIGAAGASAILALVCALLLAGAILAVRGKGPTLPVLQEDDSLAARAFELARRHPMAAGGAALLATLAAGVLAVKNPKVIATALSAYLAGRSSGRH